MIKAKLVADRVNRWYTMGVPQFGTPAFNSFLAGNVSLARQVSKHQGKDIIVTISESEFPYCTYIQNKGYWQINLPTWILSDKFYDKIAEDVTKENRGAFATGIFNGYVVHEALHSRFYPKVGGLRVDPEELLERYNIQTARKYKDLTTENKLFYFIFNIVEDIYIEGRSLEEGNFYNVFLEIIQSVFTHEQMLRDEIAVTEHTAEQFFRIMQVWRNWSLENSLLWPTQYFDGKPCDWIWNELKDVRYGNKYEESLDRMDLSRRIYEFCIQDSAKNLHKNQQNGNGSPNKSVPGANGGSFDTNPELEELIKGKIAELLGKKPEEIKKMAEKITKMIRDEWEFIKNREKATKAGFKLTDLTLENTTRNTIEPSPNFIRFGEYLRQLRTRKMTERYVDYGQSGKLAKERLTSIVTNGNIFKRDGLDWDDELEVRVALLGDISGSMNHRDNIAMTLSALFGTAVSCQSAGIPITTFIHTGYKQCEIFHTGTFGNGWKHKMRGSFKVGFNAGKEVGNSGNYDATALRYVASTFPTTPGINVLFIMSDGMPCESGDENGLKVEEYLATVANEARKNGVSVIGVALTEPVVMLNRAIYGEQNILPAYTKQLLESNLQKMIIQLSKGNR